MSKTSSRLVPAVAYVRCSTGKQEASIPEQTDAIRAYAEEKGYKIIRWYTDDAISGDETEKRLGFLQMWGDVKDRGDFEAVLCWDQSRFGRFSPQEAGHWTYPFMKAKVRLVTVDKGPIDWTNFMDWLLYSVDQHAKHEYLVNLSKDVTRGQIAAANAGSWVGSPPYGYRIEGEKKAKRLVLGEPAHTRVVQRIFREFVEERRSMNNIADRLQKEGFPSPGGRGKPWRSDTIKVILENPAYAGDFNALRYSYGKYHTAQGGKVVKGGARRRKPKEEWVIRRDHHEAIIERGLFDEAQAILARGKTGRPPHTPENNPYVFSGVLRCGKCGGPLCGKSNKVSRRYYECGNKDYNGPEACEGTTVKEDEVLLSIASFLDNWLGLEGEVVGAMAYYGQLKEDDLPEAFEQVRQLVMPRTMPKKDREQMKKQADGLRAKVQKAEANLVFLDSDRIPAAQEAIKKAESELASIEEELRKAKPPTEKEVNAHALAVLHNLYGLAACCEALARSAKDGGVVESSYDLVAPQVVKRFLGHTNHIVCHTSKAGSGTRTRHSFEGGEIVFAAVGAVKSNLNPHNLGKSQVCCR